MEITLHGHYGYRRLVRSAVPSILMMLVGSIYSVVDGLFVSNWVGTSAFAGLNIIWPAIMLFGAVGLMIGTGGSALVSQIMGQGDHDRADRVFSLLVRSTLVISLIFMVPLLLFMEPLGRLLGAEGETLRHCVIYGSICTIGLPGFMLQMCFQSFYMTSERPQLGTKMSIACALTNIVLDAVFIVGFGWGLAGAAAASMIACALGGGFPFWYYSSKYNRSSLRMLPIARGGMSSPAKGPVGSDGSAPEQTGSTPEQTGSTQKQTGSTPEQTGSTPEQTGSAQKQPGISPVQAGSGWSALGQACSNGLSEYVGNISFNVLAICYNLQLLKMMGENGVAAYSVLLYYGYIFAAVFFGYNISLTPIVGYNYGSGNKQELKSLLHHSLLLLLTLGFLMTLVSELSAGPAARLFVGYDPDLSALTRHAIRLYMVSFFISGINLFTSAWFTGLGNGKVSAAVAFIRNLVLELGFVFLLPALIGEDGIWLAVDAAEFCCLILCATLLLAYRKRYGY